MILSECPSIFNWADKKIIYGWILPPLGPTQRLGLRGGFETTSRV